MPDFTVNVPVTGTITVTNATSATVTGLPTGVAVLSTTVSGSDLIITLSGTPTVQGESYNLQVVATNACGNGLTTTTKTGGAGSGTVGAPTCTTPSASTLSPLVGTVGTTYTGTVTISNATTATITNLPGGLTQSGAVSGANYVITVTGTPTTASTTALLADATNACGTATTSFITGASIGSLAVATQVFCPTPVAGDISAPTATAGMAFYTGTITVQNATSATVTNLPSGLTQSGAVSGANYVITITGTPAVAATTLLLVNATNACGGGATTSSASGLEAGSLVVSPAVTCPAPSVGTITPATAGTNVAYNGTLPVLNATSAVINNLPNGLAATGVQNGSDYVLSIFGTPTADATITLLVDAINACSTGATTSATNQNGGVLNITTGGGGGGGDGGNGGDQTEEQ